MAAPDSIDPADLIAGEGATPESALNSMPPGVDVPRFALNLGTTGKSQILRELKSRGVTAALDQKGQVKIKDPQDGKWHRFDPAGWQGFGEAARDVGDVAGDVLNIGGQVVGQAIGSRGGVPGAIAGGAAGAGLTDALRTQVLGRLMGLTPDLEESAYSAGREAIVGGAASALGKGASPAAKSLFKGNPPAGPWVKPRSVPAGVRFTAGETQRGLPIHDVREWVDPTAKIEGIAQLLPQLKSLNLSARSKGGVTFSARDIIKAEGLERKTGESLLSYLKNKLSQPGTSALQFLDKKLAGYSVPREIPRRLAARGRKDLMNKSDAEYILQRFRQRYPKRRGGELLSDLVTDLSSFPAKHWRERLGFVDDPVTKKFFKWLDRSKLTVEQGINILTRSLAPEK